MTSVQVLETTLRDGSYAINFSFTTADTAAIASGLEAVGFRWIEVGHGVGLGAGERGYGAAAASDEEYMQAASEALKRARWGMFCIPGIARLEDVDLAARYGMGFIRVGTNVTEVRDSEPFIRRAKEHGLYVAANYMKSYALPPAGFVDLVRMSENFGADMVYLVDSAGSMFPHEVADYYRAIRSVTALPVGFHGHDNLGLAIANSLEMVRQGAGFVDTSLQGLGRSAGNAPTELMAAALARMGCETGIDFLGALRLGYKYVQPLMRARGRMPLDVVAGFAGFHSSFMPNVLKVASRRRVDAAQLIIAMCQLDKVHADEAVLDKLAAGLEAARGTYLDDYGFSLYVGQEESSRKA